MLQINGKPVTPESIIRADGALSFTLNSNPYAFRSQHLPDGSIVLEHEGAPSVWHRLNIASWQGKGGARHVQLQGLEAVVTEMAASSHGAAEAELSPRAPMPGLVCKILVKTGERVEKGQALAVMEAMKLQMTFSAGDDAEVEEVLVQEGEMVTEGTELVRLKEMP